MYEEHATVIQPDNENFKVWRYMDFTKLISLIDSRRLYFARADKFEDPFEGSWPRINVANREAKDTYLKSMSHRREIHKRWPQFNAINCWHMNEHESAAMWKLYLKSNEGIAIQSTYKNLKKSLIDDENIFLGKVKYIDYETEFIEDDNLLGPLFHKRMSFSHEQEVRALITRLPLEGDYIKITKETIKHGVQVKVDIETLIENIYIAPSAPEWFANLVAAVTTKYGYNFNVRHSNINKSPVF